MAEEALPPDIKLFISRHLSSVEQLEILRLLASPSESAWTVDALYKVILSSRTSIAAGLGKLAGAGLLEIIPGDPPAYGILKAPETALIPHLLRAYQEMPVRVIAAIYQSNQNTVQGFADAFKFKREQ
jgi:hypothetical protein